MSDSGPSFGSAHDPWDAPYFGAPVYLTYPAFRGTAPGAVNGAVRFRAQAEPHPAAPLEPASDPAPPARQVEPTLAPIQAPRRRGWLARLFGGR